ncbi:helix-turn-helix domain-containing protein [Thermomonospora catenispora]|uniref:helix-turn-helix domain-containing protein n=1 Tax=Thermomonospora catenispora TaxID=2493090 RepID=UPI00112316A5|nr:helix-turn-helix transcriptional regulator [Thermomonospora catenispora]TNY38008.1 XRE family transcriptional regulator [Thermomonospora catenispora]
MASDQGPVVQSALLRSELVKLRKAKGLTQEQVAKSLEWSPSKLIRLEGGRSSITKTDLDALLNEYGISSESQRDRLHALNRGARSAGWWSAYRGQVASGYLNFIGYEAGASFIRAFQSTVVPGLLQTREYSEVLTSQAVDPAELSPLINLRTQRQRELAQRAKPPRRYFVMDEAVIRRHVGIKKDPGIMPRQLEHIANVIEEERELVTVRIIPFQAGAHAGMFGPFTLLEFEGDLSDVLYLEWGPEGTQALIQGPDERVTDYAASFESLLEEALSAEESLELIRTVIEEMS